MKNNLLVSIVAPLFNEAEALKPFYEALLPVLKGLESSYEIVLVDDGSEDATFEIAESLAEIDKHVRAIRLSRNFGHQAAFTAGLTVAKGDVIITMDGDGQHPPDLIPTMLQMHKAGYDIVLTKHIYPVGTGFFKRTASEIFYKLINRISGTRMLEGGGDYRLISRQVADALINMPENTRFLRGMIGWLGFNSAVLTFQSGDRLGGKSKLTLYKLLRFALDAIFSFSSLPIQLGVFLGFAVLLLAFVEVAYVLSFWINGSQELLAPGWSSLMFAILLTGGALMILQGIIGLYVSFILLEVKRRPVFVVKDDTSNKKSR